jgi:hypothetical protein
LDEVVIGFYGLLNDLVDRKFFVNYESFCDDAKLCDFV